MLKWALFDLDDTLYPASCGLWPVLVMRMEQYMVERLGIEAAQVPEMRRRYLAGFGSTLNGLRREYNLDAIEYESACDHIHAVVHTPACEYIYSVHYTFPITDHSRRPII